MNNNEEKMPLNLDWHKRLIPLFDGMLCEADVMECLKLNDGTLRKWRELGLPFHKPQPGAKIYYKKSDLEAFFERFRVVKGKGEE